MTTLINPATKQPCEFVASVRGYVALRLTCTVSPAVQWFSLAQIETVNPVHTCAEPLTVIMPVSAAASISHTNVRVLAFKDVSLYTPAMRAA
jgi:hypothetical protein